MNTENYYEFEIKPNIMWAIIEESINAIVYLLIILLIYYILKIILGEDVITFTLGVLKTLGADINKSLAIKALKYLGVALALTYVFLKVVMNTGTTVTLEEDRVKIGENKIIKRERFLRYTDIVRILKKQEVLNTGKIIIETEDVEKPVTIEYISPLTETYKTAKEIIKDKIAEEITRRIQDSTKEEVPKENLETIMSLIKKDTVGKEDLITTINNIARTPNKEDQKNIFKIVLKELTKTRKVSRDDLKEAIDYLRETGLLKPEDLKELMELLFTAEESYAGFE